MVAGSILLGFILGCLKITSGNPAGWPTRPSPLPASFSVCDFELLPSRPRTVCWLGGLLRPIVIAHASITAAGAIRRLSVPGCASMSVCLVVCVRVCWSRAPSGGEQQVSEECDYRTQWEKAGLWQVWLKIEELARVHAGKLSAVVTCAIVGATFASITLKVEHRHRWEALNMHKCLSNFDVRLSVLLPFHETTQLVGSGIFCAE